MKRLLLLALFAFGGLAAGCYSEEPAVGVSYGYGYSAPEMDEVAPGVQVISDYDYPVFYSDGFYWRWDGGVWYRSGFYNRGWAVAYNVPVGVRGISRPEAYVHYRGGAYGGYRGGYRGGPGYRGEVRGAYRGGPARAYRSGPSRAPSVSHHR
jgi:hypothetical protein